MAPPVVGKRYRVEVGRKYRFKMRTGMDRCGVVQQVLSDTYVVVLTRTLVVWGSKVARGDQCLISRRLVTEVEEVR